jgi:very-short-patch-repair endonuclease
MEGFIMIQILNSVKELKMILNGKYATANTVTRYFDIDKDTLRHLVSRRKEEFASDGSKTITGKELSELRIKLNNDENETFKIDSKVRKISLYTVKSVLRVAMHLRDSEIASDIRDLLIDKNPALFKELYKHTNVKKFEIEFDILLNKLIPKNVSVAREVACDKYFIDFVVADCIAIEIDQNNHYNYSDIKESKREETILRNGYTIMRYNTNDDDMLSFVGEIINSLWERML